ncbi:MAG: ribosomal protein L7/L12 [Candidatus Saccharimonadales bacterium]
MKFDFYLDVLKRVTEAKNLSEAKAVASVALAAHEAAAPRPDTYKLVLTGFRENAKIPIIKEIRSLSGIGLKEAKDQSEALPAIVRKGMTGDEVNQAKKLFESAGGQVEVKVD